MTDSSQGSPPQEGGYGRPTRSEETPNFTLWIALSIVEAVVCCCFGGVVFGLIGLILAVVARQNWMNGDHHQAQQMLKACMIVLGIGLGVAVVGLIGQSAWGLFDWVTTPRFGA